LRRDAAGTLAAVIGVASASILSDFWNHQLVEHDRQWLFLVLAGFVGSFAFIRFSTRMIRSPRAPWWPGSVVSESGVHLHHLVWGIGLMIAAGTISFAGFATAPVYEICAVLFGIGIGLTIDEFALWIHLDDVYWAKEGRASVDAAVLIAAITGLLMLGVNPFALADGDPAPVAVVAFAYVLAVALVAISKGRLWHGVIGLFVNLVALYAAVRLAKPDSLWAKRFYGERNPRKQERAEARFPPDRRTERFKERVRDLIGGVTAEEYEARLAAHDGATLDAAATVRDRARAAADEREPR
jgi:hypothetical protein